MFVYVEFFYKFVIKGSYIYLLFLRPLPFGDLCWGGGGGNDFSACFQSVYIVFQSVT